MRFAVAGVLDLPGSASGERHQDRFLQRAHIRTKKAAEQRCNEHDLTGRLVGGFCKARPQSCVEKN